MTKEHNYISPSQNLEQVVAGVIFDKTYTDRKKINLLSQLLTHSNTIEERGIVLSGLTKYLMELSSEEARAQRAFSSIKQLVNTNSELIQDMSEDNWEVLGGFLEAFILCSNLAKENCTFDDEAPLRV